MKRIFNLGLLAMTSVMLTSCLAEEGFKEENSGKAIAYNVNEFPLNRLVCDPFSEEQTGLFGGLKADLYYRAPGQPIWYSTKDYIEQGKKSEQYFFMADINVPTRLFSKGFPLETGGVVKNDDGEDLIEYFALRFTTVLKLSSNDEEGLYELALLSDDGAVLRVRDNDGTYEPVVESDGDHSTRLACGTKRFHMTHDTRLMVQLDYYQGPRTEISLVPVWRKVDDTTAAETLCGLTGQRTWFDYLDDSKPTAKWHELLSHGWKVIGKSNYELPQYYSFNPCVVGVTPNITNFSVHSEGRIVATWNTDIKATTQILVTNVDTGEERLTRADNVLRKGHAVILAVPSGRYSVRAVSISDTYGKAVSNSIEVDVVAVPVTP